MFRIPAFLRRPSAPLTGLDIGVHAIRLVTLSAIDQQAPQLERYACTSLPPGAISSDGIEDLDLVSNALQQLWESSGPYARRVAIGIPAASAMSTLVQLDEALEANDDERLSVLAHMHAAHLLPYPVQQACIDFHLLAAQEDRQQQLRIAATRKEVVEDRLAIAEALGLEVLAMEIDSYAQYAAWRRTAHIGLEQHGIGLLDIDAHGMQLCLLTATQMIQRQQPHPRQPMPTDLLACAAAQLWRNAWASLDSASAHAVARLTQQHLVLTSVQDPQLLIALRQQLRISVTVAAPFSGMTTSAGVRQLPDDSPAYLTACGLALWQIAS